MTPIELLTENESVEKARKSLLVISLAVPLFAAVKFLSEELSIFGLTVQVSQDRIVQLGRIAVFFLLIIFVLRLLPGFFSWIHDFLELRDKKWEKKTLAEFPDEDYHGEDNYPEPEDYEIKFANIKEKRDHRRIQVKDLSNFLSNSVATLLNYALPIVLGLATIVKPYYLNSVLSYLN